MKNVIIAAASVGLLSSIASAGGLIDRGARAGDRFQTGLECNSVTMDDGQQYTNWRHKDLQPQEPGVNMPTVPGVDNGQAWECGKFHIAGKTYRMPGGPLGGIPQILHHGEWVNLDKLPDTGGGGGGAGEVGGGAPTASSTVGPPDGSAPGDDIGGLPWLGPSPDPRILFFPSLY